MTTRKLLEQTLRVLIDASEQHLTHPKSKASHTRLYVETEYSKSILKMIAAREKTNE